MKTFVNFTALLLIMGLIPIGFYFEINIRQLIPNYSALMHLCATVFFAGMSYSMVTRNIVMLLITIVCTIAIPYVKIWFVYYWNYNPVF